MLKSPLLRGEYYECPDELLPFEEEWTDAIGLSFFLLITFKPRVESYTKSMTLKYEPASKPLHIFMSWIQNWPTAPRVHRQPVFLLPKSTLLRGDYSECPDELLPFEETWASAAGP